jgi:phosphate transport system permease protein
MTDHSTEQRFRRRAVEERSVDDSPTPAEPAPAVLGARPEEYVAAAATPAPDVEDVPAGVPADLSGGTRRLGDRLFAGLAGGASGIVILIVILVAVFLVLKAAPSIADDKANFLTSTKFNVGKNGTLEFGIAGLLYTTVLSSILALLLAVPLAIGIALFITQYAPRRVSQPIAHAIDLLAAIPSIIYGLWGIRVLAPHLTPIQHALSHIGLGLFANENVDTGTVFDAGVVLAIMILPIITAISRDVFERTPTANREAALALGATRWEMIRMAVLPYGRPGVISGAMLGLGRALGETIAVLLILSTVNGFSFSLFSGGSTFASKIVQGSGEFGTRPGPYIAAGLVLFVLTFLVNAIARSIIARRKDFV